MNSQKVHFEDEELCERAVHSMGAIIAMQVSRKNIFGVTGESKVASNNTFPESKNQQ